VEHPIDEEPPMSEQEPRRGELTKGTDDYSEHFDEPSLWHKLSRGALDAGRRVVELALTLFFCFRDPETPMQAKAVIASALGYFILPLDAIPDFTPMVGFADDLGALMMAAAVIAVHIQPKHRRQAQQRLQEYFGEQPETDGADDPSASPTS
jgi:uncharacterized membrane protein YkvA (DUF1232 family)